METEFLLQILYFTFVTLPLATTSNHRIKPMNQWKRSSIYALSISDLQNLENLELTLVQVLTQGFLTSNKFPIGSKIREHVHRYLEDYYESNGYIDTKDGIGKMDFRISPNPICAYRLLWRIKFLLEDVIFHNQFFRHFGSVSRRISYFFKQYCWPSMDDLESLAEKILRIQYVYDLPVEQLAKGWISTLHTNCTFKSVHCYEIFKVAAKTEQFTSAIEWAELAKEIAVTDKMSSPVFLAFSLWNAIEKHNQEFEDDMKLELEPLFFDRNISHVPYDSKNATKIRSIQDDEFKESKSSYYANLKYVGLCSGRSFQTEKEKSFLFCWHEFKIHPVFGIGPMKMEFLSRNPDVVQLYDVLHDGEMQQITSDCSSSVYSPKLRVVNYQFAPKSAQVSSTSFHRSSALCEHIPSILNRIEWKLERLTGLAIAGTASEDFRIVSYTPGGHIHPHFDRTPGQEQHKTLHMFPFATLVIYLNDVDQGGGTAFTSLGISVKPVKGSAVLWFNFYADGREDFMTYHGGCPVMFGAKWAANKWIRYGSQFLNLKCGLKPKDRVRFAVNKG